MRGWGGGGGGGEGEGQVHILYITEYFTFIIFILILKMQKANLQTGMFSTEVCQFVIICILQTFTVILW